MCIECQSINDEKEMFYDCKAQKIYCKKCISKRYNYHI